MINLSKGGRVNLSKEAPGTQKFRIGLGWDANGTDTGTDFDLDVSVFLCKYDAQSNPKLISDQHFVFYNSEVRTMDRNETFIQPGDDFRSAGCRRRSVWASCTAATTARAAATATTK